MLKTWYAEKMALIRKTLFLSSYALYCEKFEIDREDQDAAGDGIQDVDIVLTTREIGRLLKQCNIDFVNLPDEDFDPAMGVSTGAGAIFAQQAVLWKLLFEQRQIPFWCIFENIEYHEVRGTQDYKEQFIT